MRSLPTPETCKFRPAGQKLTGCSRPPEHLWACYLDTCVLANKLLPARLHLRIGISEGAEAS